MKTINEFFPQSRPIPGKMLGEKLEEMDISPEEFAEYADIPEKIVNAILNGKSAITPNIAAQFERVTLIPTHYWLNRQRNYDEYINRLSQKKFNTARQYRQIAMQTEDCLV